MLVQQKITIACIISINFYGILFLGICSTIFSLLIDFQGFFQQFFHFWLVFEKFFRNFVKLLETLYIGRTSNISHTPLFKVQNSEKSKRKLHVPVLVIHRLNQEFGWKKKWTQSQTESILSSIFFFLRYKFLHLNDDLKICIARNTTYF